MKFDNSELINILLTVVATIGLPFVLKYLHSFILNIKYKNVINKIKHEFIISHPNAIKGFCNIENNKNNKKCLSYLKKNNKIKGYYLFDEEEYIDLISVQIDDIDLLKIYNK